MTDLVFSILILGSLGLIAGVLGGVIGFGTTIILMPALVHFYGPVQTVSIIAITATIANFSRVILWWRETNWKVCLVYSLTAIPAVALGANTLVLLNGTLIEAILGVFLIALIPVRRWMRRQAFTITLWHMSVVGAVIGYLTGIVATTGAINTPFFLAFGLVKGAYLGTEAASSLFMLIAKIFVFQQLGVLDALAITQGLMLGVCVTAGSILSKRIVLALPEKRFMQLMEIVMLISGLSILGQCLYSQ
jgi:uncharacterized membrane protein YfcA